MDDLEKKFFLQFDDPMPGQRANALEMWRDRNLKLDPPRTFRDVVHEFEGAISKAKAEALEKELADYKTANATAKQANDTLTRENATLRNEVARWKATAQAAVAIRVNWKKLAAGVAVVALLGGAYYWWGPAAAAAVERERVNAAVRVAIEKIAWQEGEREPFVGMLAGKPHWVMVRGETETSHVDNQGRPVVLQCSHVFAAPAVADWSGAYQPPNLYNVLGWLKWPERATVCKLAAVKQQLSDAVPNRPQSRFQLLSRDDDIPDPASPDDPPPLVRAQEAQRAMRELSSPSPAYRTGDGRDMDRLWLIENSRGAKPAVTTATLDVSALSPAALAPCPLQWGLEYDKHHELKPTWAMIADNSRNCRAVTRDTMIRRDTVINPDGDRLEDLRKGTVVVVIGADPAGYGYRVKMPNGATGGFLGTQLKPG
jgi:hypothetical protein